jgi:hypothetical protein
LAVFSVIAPSTSGVPVDDEFKVEAPLYVAVCSATTS